MKKRRTKLTLRMQKEISHHLTNRRVRLRMIENTKYDCHVRDMVQYRKNVERALANNAKIMNFPTGYIVDLPYLPLQAMTGGLFEMHHSEWARYGWVDDNAVMRRLAFNRECYQRRGWHHHDLLNQIKIEPSLLDQVREALGFDFVAIGLVEELNDNPKIYGFPVIETVRFVLPDEHDAVLFKIQWGC